MINPQKQQRRHAHVEHQRRRGVDEAVVDGLDALEQHAHEQHGEHRRRDVQRLDKKGEHAGWSRWLSLGG
ncbi:hypothetical protein D3C76_868980 [compost metagenome]